MEFSEIILYSIVFVFLFSYIYYTTNNVINYKKEILLEENQFLTGRYVIKLLTESSPYISNFTCNLTENFFYVFDSNNFTEFISNYSIKRPIYIYYINLSDNTNRSIGNFNKGNYIEFRRLCNYKNYPIIVGIIVS